MTYPIGARGTPWSQSDRDAWRAMQRKQRSYADDVMRVVEHLRDVDVITYGRLEADVDGSFPLVALRSRRWDPSRPVMLVTGGVHGYETSGVHGALAFVSEHGEDYAGRANVLVAPCVSPWAYERIQRWNANAVDPNRSFKAEGQSEEAHALIRLVASIAGRVVMHVDLHETTDTDESEFRPALAARDGKPHEPGTIPDGFYLVDDTEDPQPEFQAAIIDAVAKVTHIAPADPDGTIIGSPVVSPGVIRYPLASLGLCAGLTQRVASARATFVTTTEVYPDSPRATAAQCNAAQVAAVRAGIDFALAREGR